MFHTGAPELVVQCGLLKAEEGRYCRAAGGQGAGGAEGKEGRGQGRVKGEGTRGWEVPRYGLHQRAVQGAVCSPATFMLLPAAS